MLGYRHCTGYATWDVTGYPRLTIAVGTSLHSFGLAGTAFAGTADHDDGIAYRIAGDTMGPEARAAGASFDMRVTNAVTDHFYLGVEGQMGGVGLVGGPVMVSQGDSLLLQPHGGLYLAGGGLAGAVVSIGAYDLRGEVVAGGRAVGLQVHSQHLNCTDDSTAWGAQPWIEPRVAIERWVSPWVTVGAFAGENALRRGDTSFGLTITGHVRAFDARR